MVYDAGGFCEKNRDVLFKDCIALLKGSSKYVEIISGAVITLSIFVAASSRACFRRISKQMSGVDQQLLVLRLGLRQMI